MSLHLRNLDAILPIDVKGKPSERMGHKAIGPHPGAVPGQAASYHPETLEPILCAVAQGIGFLVSKQDQNGEVDYESPKNNTKSYKGLGDMCIVSNPVNRRLGRKPCDLLFRFDLRT